VHVKYRLTFRKCGRFFMAKRFDAMYFSAACMQEAYRRRKLSKQI
jgi:hypothetical protein